MNYRRMANFTHLLILPAMILTTVLLSFASAENTAYVQVDTCTSYCNATMFQDCQCTNNTILECNKTRWVGIYLSMTVNDTGPINTNFPLFYTLMYNSTTFCQGHLQIPIYGKEVNVYLPESDNKGPPRITLATFNENKMNLKLEQIENSNQTALSRPKPTQTSYMHINNTKIRLSDIRVYYDCVAEGEYQLCDETGHTKCVPGYYGDKCRLYCNATMFDNCNCSKDGELRCSERPVGVYFEVRLISAHVSPSMHNISYTLFLDQSYRNISFRRFTFSPLILQEKPDLTPLGFSNNTMVFFYPSFDSFENASCTISIKKDGNIKAGQIFHLNDVSSSRSVNSYANLTLPRKKNDSDLYFNIQVRLAYNCTPSSDNWECNKTGELVCKENFFGDNCQKFCNRSMEHGNCSVNGQQLCETHYFGDKCDVFCNVTMPQGNCSENGGRICETHYFGDNCDVFCNVTMPQGNCSENGSRICATNYFGDNCDVFCNVTMPQGNCSENGSRICATHYFGDKCDVFCNVTMPQGNCSENGSRRCESNYFGESCDVFCESSIEYERCRVNKTNECEVKACCGSGDCPVVVLNNGIQNYQQDSLSNNWRLIASILGAISIALCIVLFAEIGKTKYRNMMRVSSMLTPDTMNRNAVK